MPAALLPIVAGEMLSLAVRRGVRRAGAGEGDGLLVRSCVGPSKVG